LTRQASVELIGHRGARGLFPENTRAGFQAAMAMGITRFELDAAVTADGIVVVHHDTALNPDIARDASGAWLVAPTPLIRNTAQAALARYDVGRIRPGSPTAARFPEQTPDDGARIPTLAEILALPAHFTIEIKSVATRPDDTIPPAAMAEHVAAVIDAAGAAERIIVSSFDWRVQRAMRRLRPAIPLAYLTSADTVREAMTWWDGSSPAAHGNSVARAVAAEGGPIWSPEYPDVGEDDIAEAHALGLRVVTWTVNRTADMERLTGWGVDGIITDHPNRAPASL
jgi:glycerophosphoryl diester phosphodiesterase